MINTAIFKANDIRGIVSDAKSDGLSEVSGEAQWDEAGAATIAAAYVELMDLAGKSFILGHDMRLSGPRMVEAFAEAAAKSGANVIDVGLVSTDQLWYVSGALNLPGVQFTASHNPPEYNGMKFCEEAARPVTPDFLAKLKELSIAKDGQPVVECENPGTISKTETLDDYAAYLHSLVSLSGIRKLKVLVDAGNGMAGHTAKAVLGVENIELVGLYLDLDGSFPNHQPNPLIPENLVDAQRKLVETGADVALVFDGDADRCFIIDEKGQVVNPSIVTAMIASNELRREPGAAIVVNTITGHVVHDVVNSLGGKLVTSRVGHTYIKALMAENNAIFGGEHSAHYYFRDFWGADTGMLAGLHVLSLLGSSDKPLSELAAEYDTYFTSGEINSTVNDPEKVMAEVAKVFENRAAIDWSDGLLVSASAGDRGRWWLSLRPSNTEPLLRLNVEATDSQVMAALRDDVLDMVAKLAEA